MSGRPFLEIPEDSSDWNACVGAQTYDDAYSDGYIQSAIILAETLLEKELFDKLDSLVFPILYSARHGLELSLKSVMTRLTSNGFRLRPIRLNHDISEIWSCLSDSQIGDNLIKDTIQKIRPYVESLSTLDVDGQEFRYATKRDGQKSLEGTSLINIPRVRDDLKAMSELLEVLYYRVSGYCTELSTGSFTKSLSRRDLMQISMELPSYREWNSETFDAVREQVKKKFAIESNKSLSDALNIVKGQRQMRVNIGLESDLLCVTDVNFLRAVELHLQFRSSDQPSDPGKDKFDFRSFFDSKKERIRREVVDRVNSEIPLDQRADLETIFYTGRDNDFVETYEKRFEKTLLVYKRTEDQRRVFFNVFAKTNFLMGLTKGAMVLGRPSLVDEANRLMK